MMNAQTNQAAIVETNKGTKGAAKPRKPRAEAPKGVDVFANLPSIENDARFSEFAKRVLSASVNFKVAAEQETQTMIKLVEMRIDRIFTQTGEKQSVEWSGILENLKNPAFSRSLAALMGTKIVDVRGLVHCIGNHHKEVPSDSTIQAKSIVKVINLIYSLAAGDFQRSEEILAEDVKVSAEAGKVVISNYTLQILYNAFNNGGELSIEGCIGSLNRVVAMGINACGKEQIKNAERYTQGTAGSQTSQVRDVMRVLGLAEVNKGKRADIMKIYPHAREALRSLCGIDPTGQSL